MDPNNLKALYLRGSAYSKKSQFANAIKDLTSAIEINPNHIDALYNRGIIIYDILQQKITTILCFITIIVKSRKWSIQIL